MPALLRKESLILLRDRHGLAVLFIMPAVFILVMSLALRDVMAAHLVNEVTVLWQDEDQQYFASMLRELVDERPGIRTQEAEPGQDLSAQLKPSGAVAAVYIAPDFKKRLNPDYNEAMLELRIDPSYPAATRELLLVQIRGVLIGLRAEYLSEDIFGAPEAEAELIRLATHPDSIKLALHGEQRESAEALPNATQQSVPAWIVFAMFFILIPLSTSVLAERNEGTLQRLALVNASRLSILMAKLPVYLAVTTGQAYLMLLIGEHLVPALGGEALRVSGHALALLPITLATGAAAIGMAMLIAVVAHSSVQATTTGGVLNLMLGALGGIMVPKQVMPQVLQSAGQLSPMSWALEGYWDVILRQQSAIATLPECSVLLGLGAFCMVLAATFFRLESK